MLELDIGGWLLGPGFLSAVALLISALLTSIATVLLEGVFGVTT